MSWEAGLAFHNPLPQKCVELANKGTKVVYYCAYAECACGNLGFENAIETECFWLCEPAPTPTMTTK